MRVPIAERKLQPKSSVYGWRTSELPDIFGDELSMDDYLVVSHTSTKTSHKIKVSDLMMFIQKHIHERYD